MFSKLINTLTEQLANVLPKSPDSIKSDIKKNIRAILEDTFNRLELVTRDEFDIQKKLLSRCIKRIEALEARIEELEKGSSK